jgi:RecA-family ATPase
MTSVEPDDLGARLNRWAEGELEHDDERAAIEQTEETQEKKRCGRPTLDWSILESLSTPERQWALDHWVPMRHVTLLAGAGGVGKSLVAQAMGSCLALRREYIDWPPQQRRVLAWFCEDDRDELWRRQLPIAKLLDVPLSAFGDFTALSYDGQDVELAGITEQRLSPSSMLIELREQIGDYKADVVFLDNIARLFGGNENDRHQVTTFIAWLTRAAQPTGAAIVLLGHPGKAQGSEYSGSTAWEGAVRARLFLGRTLPDADQDHADEPTEDDGVRYLCRRKANYSPRDWRRLTFRDGVLVPDATPETNRRNGGVSIEYSRDVVGRAVRKLADMSQWGVAGKNSPNFLPKLARTYKLLENITERDFTQAMRAMEKEGALVKAKVGQYGNRNKREGLVLAAAASN